MFRHSILITAATGIVLACELSAQQQPAATGTVVGRVVRAADGAPVGGADVMLVSSQRGTTTDSAGVFRIGAVAVGRQVLLIRRVGYDVWRDTIDITSGTDSTLRFVLREPTTALDTVRTTASSQTYISPMLRGFEERRHAAGPGRFISDSVLRRSENSQLTNVIMSHFPGLTLGAGRMLVSTRKHCKGLVIYRSSDRDQCQQGQTSDCFVSIFVDGALLYSARLADQGVRAPDLNQQGVSNFAGIEFYADNGTAPSSMHTDDEGCGSLWLWTREK